MKVIYGIGRLKLTRPSCVAVGVFDGLHRGHQSVIKRVVSIAKKKKVQSVVLTFFPHPDSVIKSKNSPLLISLKHRLNLIESFGVDVCVVVRFNSKFSKIKARDFMADILIKKCRARILVVSGNFVFGRDRLEGPKSIKRLADDFNLKALFLPGLKVNKMMISSTLIRALISSGNLKQASKLLGRGVEVVGTVVGGDNRGRKLGFPTANIDPHHEVVPPQGVYAIEAWLNKKRLLGLANIGFRPTFKKDNREIIEIHLLNFRKNIYGKEIRVVFIKKLRSERSFKQKSHLISQINRDIQQTRTFFSV